MDSFQVLFSLCSTCVFKFSFFVKENSPEDLQHCVTGVIYGWETEKLGPWILLKGKAVALR